MDHRACQPRRGAGHRFRRAWRLTCRSCVRAPADRSGRRWSRRPPTRVSPPLLSATCRAAISCIGARARSACRRAASSMTTPVIAGADYKLYLVDQFVNGEAAFHNQGPGAPDRRHQNLRRLRARRAGRGRCRRLHHRGGVVRRSRIHHRRNTADRAAAPTLTLASRRRFSPPVGIKAHRGGRPPRGGKPFRSPHFRRAEPHKAPSRQRGKASDFCLTRGFSGVGVRRGRPPVRSIFLHCDVSHC